MTVSGQGEAERQEALPSALVQVLKKLSGLRHLPPDPVLFTVLADADRTRRDRRVLP